MTINVFDSNGLQCSPVKGHFVLLSDYEDVESVVKRLDLELDRLRRELAEVREDADTYRQERDDISGNYQRLERRSLELVRGGANLLRELAEARELLAEWCREHSLCARGTLLARSLVAATPSPSAPPLSPGTAPPR
jgi:hypothetical protein